LPPATLAALGKELENQFFFLFTKLNMAGTKVLLDKYVPPVDVPLQAPRDLVA